MSKAKRSLLFSLFTLIMAVAITATSTYAWFVVNKEVTASNMQVTVKSDTTYLVISGASTTVEGGTALDSTEVTYSATASDAEVLPVRYNEGATPAEGNTKWETASGTSYTNGAASGSYAAVATGSLSIYTVKYTFYVGLTATSSANASNLKIKDLVVTNTAASNPDNTFMDAVSVMVECIDKGTDGTGTTSLACVNCTNTASTGGLNALTQSQCENLGTLATTVALEHVYQIDAYVYINGDNSVVKSENAAHIASFALEIQLEVTPAS